LNRARRPVDEHLVQQASLRLHVESPFVTGATPMHLQQVAAAKVTGSKIRQAVLMARLSAWTTLLFGIGTLLTSVTSLGGLMVGMGMVIVALIEFKSGTAMKCLDIIAPKRLATNQIAFGCLLLSYAAMCLWSGQTSPSLLTDDPQLSAMLAPIRDLEATIHKAVYLAMMIAAVVGPGLLALYYRSRKKHIELYLKQTPKWIIELQRAGMSV
jgi:hypothetical protein